MVYNPNFAKPGSVNPLRPASNSGIGVSPQATLADIVKMSSLAELLPASTSAMFQNQIDAIISKFHATQDLIMQRINKDVILSTFKHIILNTKFIAMDPTDRQTWLSHFLAIMYSESRLNPSATNTAASGKILAYGLFQHTPTTWSHQCVNFKDTAPGVFISQRPEIKTLASVMRNSMTQIMAPLDKYGPAHAAIYQIVPLFAMARSLAANMNSYFSWSTEKGWHANPNNVKIDKALVNTWINKLLGQAVFSYYAGRQLLLTILHTNGVNWALNPKYPSYWGTRAQQDLRLFGTLINSPQLAKIIVSIAPVDLPEVTITANSSANKVVITSPFWDMREEGPHKGVDIRARGPLGLYAPESSTVRFAGWSSDGRAGQMIIIALANGLTLGLMHLSKILVVQNQKLAAGDKIALTGNTKSPTTTVEWHLHVQAKKGTQLVDPLDPQYGINLNALLHPTAPAVLGNYTYKQKATETEAVRRYPLLSKYVVEHVNT